YNHGFSRELSDLQKYYWSDAQKYSGTLEESFNFNFKFLIFINSCKRSGIPPNIVPQAFPIMLHGSALDYFYHNCDGHTLTIKELHRQFIQRYENEEHRRNMERKWNSISLRKMILENQNLPMETTSKITTPCEDVEACSSACSRPPANFTELVEAIHSSIASHEKARIAQEIDPIPLKTLNQTSNVNFVDQTYHNTSMNHKSPGR
ncbi:putative glycosyl transferase, partial [Golovinomyces cichoracearum]